MRKFLVLWGFIFIFMVSVVSADILLVPSEYLTIGDAITAITAANSNDTIIVSPGIYTENIDLAGKEITLTSENPDDPNVVAETIIDGGAAGSVITCNSGETVDTVITGFTIRNGNGDDSGNGGGISCKYSSPVIKNCIISANSATGAWGGGIFCWGKRDGMSPTVSNCTFIGNTVSTYGGGIACYQSDVIVTNCVFNGNNAAIKLSYGG